MKTRVVILILLLFVACGNNNATSKPVKNVQEVKNVTKAVSEKQIEDVKEAVSPKDAQEPSTGTLYVGIKDKAIDFKDIKRVTMKIESVHIVRDEPVSMPLTNKEFDLVTLKESGSTELVGSIALGQGTYSEIQIVVSDVTVNKGGSDKNTKMPSRLILLPAKIEISPGKSSVVLLDFLGDKSVHVTGQGRIIFAPVIGYESNKDVSVQVSGKNLLVGSGVVVEKQRFGMKPDGSMGLNYAISPDASLSWENNRLLERAVEPEIRFLGSGRTDTKKEAGYGGQSQRKLSNELSKSASYDECVSRCKESCMGSACKGCEDKCY